MNSGTNSDRSAGAGAGYFVGLGANLPSHLGSPLDTLIGALAALEANNIRVLARSPWFESEPVPRSAQDWFINAVIYIFTLESAFNILQTLHKIELDTGRARSVPNAARPLDLDLLAAADGHSIQPENHGAPDLDLSGRALILPHPRLAERAFVLKPWAAIAPNWIYPQTGQSVAAMAANLPDQPIVHLLRG